MSITNAGGLLKETAVKSNEQNTKKKAETGEKPPLLAMKQKQEMAFNLPAASRNNGPSIKNSLNQLQTMPINQSLSKATLAKAMMNVPTNNSNSQKALGAKFVENGFTAHVAKPKK